MQFGVIPLVENPNTKTWHLFPVYNGIDPVEKTNSMEANDKMAIESRKGKIYFLKDNIGGLIKIGFSTNCSERVKSLINEIPGPSELLAVVDGSMDDEKAMHKRFDYAEDHGEWFRPVPELIKYIQSIKQDLTSQDDACCP